jgi:hypothetical protein
MEALGWIEFVSRTSFSSVLDRSGVAGENSRGFTTLPSPALAFDTAGSLLSRAYFNIRFMFVYICDQGRGSTSHTLKLADPCAATISSPPLCEYSLLRELILAGSFSFSPVLVKWSGGALPAVGDPEEYRCATLVLSGRITVNRANGRRCIVVVSRSWTGVIKVEV